MKDVFTVPSTGRRLHIRPMSADIVRRLNAERQNLPSPPTYEVEYPGGESERVAHDETTLETEEDRAAWQEYVRLHNAAAAAWEQRWMRALVMLCLPALEYDEGWAADFEYIGIDVPDDPRERKVFYANNVLLPTAEDKRAFSETVTILSTIRREDLARVRSEFPGTLSRLTAEPDEPVAERLDDLDEIPGGAGDGEVGAAADAVG